MEQDVVYVPRTRPGFSKHCGIEIEHLSEMTDDDSSGEDSHKHPKDGPGTNKKTGLGVPVNHFNPQSPLFEARDAKWILLSDLGLLITATALYLTIQSYGWQNVTVWYFLPYLWVNSWQSKFFLQYHRSFLYIEKLPTWVSTIY
jgi:omega-6 fatty acid desaturase / acyl-lipid omega-6 desaturase (Delta-12 desaturase)